ncbi:hypothetical protein LTR53_005353 [Teratosphaeriaceae sp. CCFEE 6253]|nr:hypothetical protein LTR53_005353 [Teratosphaeriaceae sp. CCFEE 6253]
MSQYPRRDPGCKRLHRDASLDTHPGWPGPADPPTGTPKNGKRSARRRGMMNAQQLATPPDTQETHTPAVNNASAPQSREHGPATPTPGEYLFATTPVLETHSSPVSKRTKYHADAIAEPEQSETDDDWTDTTWQDTPSPATSLRASRTPSLNLWSHPSNPMTQSAALSSSRASPAPSLLVPDTIRDDTPTLLEHHHRAMARRNHSHNHNTPFSPSTADSNDPEHTDLERLRIRQARMTETLHESTALVNRLRTRGELQAMEVLRERAVAATATRARDAATAGRAQAVRNAVAGAQADAVRQARVARRLRVALMVVMAAVAGYAMWCFVNQPGYRYIRKVRERRFGM